jgi:hypothetical protein
MPYRHICIGIHNISRVYHTSTETYLYRIQQAVGLEVGDETDVMRWGPTRLRNGSLDAPPERWLDGVGATCSPSRPRQNPGPQREGQYC